MKNGCSLRTNKQKAGKRRNKIGFLKLNFLKSFFQEFYVYLNGGLQEPATGDVL